MTKYSDTKHINNIVSCSIELATNFVQVHF